jgi:hypothetical protein
MLNSFAKYLVGKFSGNICLEQNFIVHDLISSITLPSKDLVELRLCGTAFTISLSIESVGIVTRS